ncbi:DUF2510 domain-containing protein [Mumia sp. zg.B53]|uniref:DUF2510 domain-containing protein n=1 Tax=Mumia sp. zg.B53 TaxID=2855449 RepID=UPI001C6E47FE|nr:DUF2510 domain-containing protein [Mumia sp. zg.B53]MBW9215728.1 DUF2510 domain-containing protein [Mumia sp. zg.B53]
MADPGWYPDPQSPAGQRYWDGGSWTDYARALPPPAPRKRRPNIFALILASVLGLAAVSGVINQFVESTPSSSTDECVMNDQPTSATSHMTTVQCDDPRADFRVGDQVDNPNECESVAGASSDFYMTKETELAHQTYCLMPVD